MRGVTRLFWACAGGSAALILAACTAATSSSAPLESAPPVSSNTKQPCTATDLSLAAHWQGATGSLAGALRLDVTAPTGCALPGQLQVELVDGQGQSLPVDEVAAPDLCDDPQGASGCLSQATVEVEPGQSALVRFAWQNWCGPPPSGYVGVEVLLPSEPQPLSVLITDASGTSSVDTPRCDAPDVPSTLAVGPVEVPDGGGIRQSDRRYLGKRARNCSESTTVARAAVRRKVA
jgi:Protein of unknown function (DUF4232)